MSRAEVLNAQDLFSHFENATNANIQASGSRRQYRISSTKWNPERRPLGRLAADASWHALNVTKATMNCQMSTDSTNHGLLSILKSQDHLSQRSDWNLLLNNRNVSSENPEYHQILIDASPHRT